MITIKTKLHPGIYQSSGGGKIRVHYEWTTGPRNLLKAVRTLREHSASMTSAYGNIGHTGSWIEIDGVSVREIDFNDILKHDREIYGSDFSNPLSPTQKARDLIDELLS